MLFTILIRNGKCYLQDISYEAKKELIKEFSYELPNSYFIKKNSSWDGVVRLYNERYNSFSIGLLERAKEIIKRVHNNTNVEFFIKDTRAEPVKLFHRESLNGITLRDYQKEAVDKFLENKIGLLNIAVGGGKTEIALECFRRIGCKTLVIVHTKELFNSWIKRINERLPGVNVGRINSLEVTNGDIIICMIQSLVRKLKSVSIRHLLMGVGFIIIDECHHVPANSFSKVLNYCWNSVYRLGLSGTAFREDGRDLSITAGVGEIIYSVSINELKSRGYLSSAKILISDLKPYSGYNISYDKIYNDYIVNNDERNKKIVDIAKKCSREGNTLILVSRLDHLSKLHSMLPGSIIISSKLNDEERKKVVSRLYDREDNIVISTQVFDEGVDFPNLCNLILGGGGKSNIKTIQRLGRVLRKFKGKVNAMVYDFRDNAKYLFKHFERRVDLYISEGFSIEYI